MTGKTAPFGSAEELKVEVGAAHPNLVRRTNMVSANKEATTEALLDEAIIDEEIIEEASSGVTADMKEAAAADLKRLNTNRKNNKRRTFKREGAAQKLYVSDLFEFPADFNLDGIGPMSYLAQPEGEITGSIDTQEFTIKEELLKGLTFEPPGRKLERGRALRTVKALKPNGVLSQLPFEGQINNGAAGDVKDALGIRYYQRKGFLIFMNFDTLEPIYCFARNCHAAAMVPQLAQRFPQHADVIGSGYCSYEHMVFTEPNLARNAAGLGMFGLNATTTRSWERNR
jgi:hypothetical protein